ncbi:MULTISPECIES: hypothetical protein [Paenibacillus]|jgi:hypothetical protein|uniref:DUF2207 domain-containing protein n=1 Tax=Paenibacillus azoreducens TaxID=116718 RepID=A0A919YEC8_9BACL|nr:MULTISPECIES: hypothetical protein [Paenibacillus]MBE9913022.1 hypothetical protein [Paenibacillus donghaensis]GIO47703.1 hypothetical protein J34TS1_24680 [Paenibacillus azoreducens]
MKRHALIFWIAIVLAAIGLISNIIFGDFAGLAQLLIPFAVFGIVFLLYKFPPRRYAKRPKVKPSARTMEKVNAAKRSRSAGKQRKQYPFRVIEGSKGKNDDQQPKYH